MWSATNVTYTALILWYVTTVGTQRGGWIACWLSFSSTIYRDLETLLTSPSSGINQNAIDTPARSSYPRSPHLLGKYRGNSLFSFAVTHRIFLFSPLYRSTLKLSVLSSFVPLFPSRHFRLLRYLISLEPFLLECTYTYICVCECVCMYRVCHAGTVMAISRKY